MFTKHFHLPSRGHGDMIRAIDQNERLSASHAMQPPDRLLVCHPRDRSDLPAAPGEHHWQ